MRRNVDLPQPEGPISAVTLPGSMVSDTRSRTLWSPNQAETRSASSFAPSASGASAFGWTAVTSGTSGRTAVAVPAAGAGDGSSAVPEDSFECIVGGFLCGLIA